jgi:hypothetical protein
MRTALALSALLSAVTLAWPATAGERHYFSTITIGTGLTYYSGGHGGYRSHPFRPRPSYYSAYGRHRLHGHYFQTFVYRPLPPPPVVYYQAPPVVYYQAPPRPAYVVAPPTVVYQANPGYCREYLAPIVVGGREVMGYGRACWRSDGSWEKGPLRPEQ